MSYHADGGRALELIFITTLSHNMYLVAQKPNPYQPLPKGSMFSTHTASPTPHTETPKIVVKIAECPRIFKPFNVSAADSNFKLTPYQVKVITST